jgi:hypothetical protein
MPRAGLDCDSPTYASHIAGIMGVLHHASLKVYSLQWTKISNTSKKNNKAQCKKNEQIAWIGKCQEKK